MNYIEAKYLKHCGANIDVKVSFRIIDGEMVVCMRDFEFKDFSKALNYLQFVQKNEIGQLEDKNDEVMS